MNDVFVIQTRLHKSTEKPFLRSRKIFSEVSFQENQKEETEITAAERNQGKQTFIDLYRKLLRIRSHGINKLDDKSVQSFHK